jgi:hypothetical protein
MKFIRNAIKSTDTLSDQVQFHYKGSNRIQSIIGGILTTLIGCITMALVVYLGLQLLHKNKPISRFNKTHTSNYTQTLEDFPFLFVVSLPGTGQIPNIDEYLWIHGRYYELYTDPQTNQLGLKEYRLKLEKCNPDVHFGKYKDYFMDPNAKVPLTDAYCLNPKILEYANGTENTNFTINFMNPYATTPSHFVSIFVEDCYAPFTHFWNMYYPANKTCKAPQEIKDMLKYFFFYLYHVDSYIDLNDHENPRKQFITQSTVTLSKSTYRKQFVSVKNTIINTDNGILIEDVSSDNFPQLDQYHSELAVGDDQLLILELDFETSHLMDVYDRSYIKVQEIMAEVGGFFKFLITIATLLVKLFSNNKLYISIGDKYVDHTTQNNKLGLPSLHSMNQDSVSKMINLNSMLEKQRKIVNNNEVETRLTFGGYLKATICKKSTTQTKITYEKVINIINERLSIEYYLKQNIKLDVIGSIIIPQEKKDIYSKKFMLEPFKEELGKLKTFNEKERNDYIEKLRKQFNNLVNKEK